MEGESFPTRTLIRRYLQTKEKEMEREDPRTCVFSPSGLKRRPHKRLLRSQITPESTIPGAFVSEVSTASRLGD